MSRSYPRRRHPRTPTAEPTSTPTETAVPATETPVPVTETPIPVTETAEPATTDTAPQAGTASKAGAEIVPLLTLSSNPGFLTPGGIINLDWSITGIDPSGLILQIILPR